MINCSNCGAENMVTSIFCHSCGAKLDLNEAAPEKEFEREAQEKKKKQLVSNIIKGTIGVIVLGLLVAVFFPVSVPEYTVTEDEKGTADERWQWLNSTQDEYDIPFTTGQATWILNNKVIGAEGNGETGSESEEKGENGEGEKDGKKDEGGGFQVWGPPQGYVKIIDEKTVRVGIRNKMLGVLPFTRTVTFTVTGETDVPVEINSGRVGLLPAAGGLKGYVASWITGTQQPDAVNTIKQKVADITLKPDSDEIVLTSGK